jgi:uncharacterized protein (DUF1778 family)
MAKANPAYHKRELYSEAARILAESGAGQVMTLARYYAREVIKQELRAKGVKLHQVEASEITRSANQYVEDHPEIIAFASERYRSLVASGRSRPPRKPKLCRI